MGVVDEDATMLEDVDTAAPVDLLLDDRDASAPPTPPPTAPATITIAATSNIQKIFFLNPHIVFA